MVEEDRKEENTDDLLCIHWGYLNVLQLHDVSGKKIKNPSWQTFWTDLCGSTIRFYKDTTLSGSTNTFPPATMIGPRPENQTKYAFFSLTNSSLKDYDAVENSPKLSRKHKMGRKHVLQIVLANFSVYFLQAPTMSAFYRWRMKIQSSIDYADSHSENFYEKELHQAKMALYEQRRYNHKPGPTYPEAVTQDAESDDDFSMLVPLPPDPRVVALREKLSEKRRLLHQLEKQERDFLGSDKKCTITRIEFSATASRNYFLVIGRPDTLIPEGRTITVFGRLPNGRWRCCVDREDDKESRKDNVGHDIIPYPLIGSVPTSAILELNQPSRIKDLVDSLSLSSSEASSPPGTPADDLSTTNTFTYDVIPPSSQSPRRSSNAAKPNSQAARSEPYSNHKYGDTLAPPKGPFPTSDPTPSPIRPTQLSPSGNQVLTHRVPQPSDSSISPTSPRPQSVSNAISDLNRALESLAALKPNPRPRVASNVSTCSRTSNSSTDSSDMNRGSRIELNSDDEADSKNIVAAVRRRKRRSDIHISRKLHAKGISIIVGSSSSSEDEDDEVKVLKSSGTLKGKRRETESR